MNMTISIWTTKLRPFGLVGTHRRYNRQPDYQDACEDFKRMMHDEPFLNEIQQGYYHQNLSRKVFHEIFMVPWFFESMYFVR